MEIITTDNQIYKKWIDEHESNGDCNQSSLEVMKYEISNLLDCLSKSNKKYVMFCEKEWQVTDAAYRVASEIENAVLIYGDSDEIRDGKRENPFFKPDWSPDTYRSFDYIGHTAIYHREKLLQLISGIELADSVSQYKLTELYIKNNQLGREEIYHVSEILYHENPTKKILSEKYVMPRYELSKNERGKLPKASIIIPSKDNPEILKQCIDSIIEVSTYPNYEIIVVDNGSNIENYQWITKYLQSKGVQYIYKPMEFNFSKMCNIGVASSVGEVVILLNDDILIPQNNWLEIMVEQAVQDHTGAVGVKLYYPDSKKIQHIGVLNLEVGPSHAFLLEEDEGDLYFGRNIAPYNTLIVTAACLAVTREKYDEVCGLNEELHIAYNDVDFCLKLYERGYYNVVRNDVQLFHYESISRGSDFESESKMKRLIVERESMYNKHPAFRNRDPFYNINLTQTQLDFSMAEDDLYVCTGEVRWLDTLPAETRNIGLHIERLVVGENVLIKGWLTAENRGLDENAQKNILIPFNKKYLEIPIKNRMRKDVQEFIGADSSNLGFVCVFPREYLVNLEVPIGFSFYTEEVSFVFWSTHKISEKIVPVKLSMQDMSDDCAKDSTELFLAAIDHYFTSGRRLYLNGWAFKVQEKNNLKYHYDLIVQNREKFYRVPVQRLERYDLCAQFADQNYILNSGFETDVELPEEMDKDFKLLLLVKDMESLESEVVRLN